MISARELGAFTVVGTGATGVQLGIVAAGVPCGMSPLAANALGFFASFAVSFLGHARWSFPIESGSFSPALRRFAFLSSLSFWLNQACYAGALRWTTLDYRVALFAVIVSLAVVQLLASKHWAFAFDRDPVESGSNARCDRFGGDGSSNQAR
jgi:putative flippase GtrA